MSSKLRLLGIWERPKRLKAVQDALSTSAPDLLYWGLDDYLVIATIALSIAGIYLAFEITRIAQGAPRGWYFLIAALAFLLTFRVVQLYFDVQSQSDYIDDLETSISVVAEVLLVIGLYMLNRSFRRRAKVEKSS